MNAKLEFVDTNVLLYSIDKSETAKQAKAETLLGRLWQSGTGCLSVQVLQEFYVNATRKLRHPVDSATACQLVEDYGLWVVHAPSVASIVDAIKLHRADQISFWDAMIVTSAKSLGAAVVWSEDLNAGQRFDSLTIQTPFS